jgi:hypothetical protein
MQEAATLAARLVSIGVKAKPSRLAKTLPHLANNAEEN